MRIVSGLAVLILAVSLVGCGSLNRDSMTTDHDTMVVIGVSLAGLPVQRLGHHYQFNFVNAEGAEFQVTRQLRATDHFVVVEGLPPGDWQWKSFSPRATPGVTGFNPVSARAQAVQLEFSVPDQTALMLSQQLTITHSEGLGGAIDANPRTTALQSSVQSRITNWFNAQANGLQIQLEPVGVRNVPEVESGPSLFERLFGA